MMSAAALLVREGGQWAAVMTVRSMLHGSNTITKIRVSGRSLHDYQTCKIWSVPVDPPKGNGALWSQNWPE